MSAKTKQKRIATLNDPTIDAVVSGQFRFRSRVQAIQVLQRIFKHFAVAKEQPPIGEDGCLTLTLWIRGYGVTDEEKAKGYKGHFARVSIQKSGDDKFTLKAEKQATDITHHPEKSRTGKAHPDVGHPIIRAARSGKVYTDIEQARLELLRLHEEFPTVSIPGTDKLYILLYYRESKPPIRKMKLSVAPVAQEGFRLVLADNVRPLKAPEEKPVVKTAAGKAVEGKFSSMVAMQRKGRKKPVIKPKKNKDNE